MQFVCLISIYFHILPLGNRRETTSLRPLLTMIHCVFAILCTSIFIAIAILSRTRWAAIWGDELIYSNHSEYLMAEIFCEWLHSDEIWEDKITCRGVRWEQIIFQISPILNIFYITLPLAHALNFPILTMSPA